MFEFFQRGEFFHLLQSKTFLAFYFHSFEFFFIFYVEMQMEKLHLWMQN